MIHVFSYNIFKNDDIIKGSYRCQGPQAHCASWVSWLWGLPGPAIAPVVDLEVQGYATQTTSPQRIHLQKFCVRNHDVTAHRDII